MKVLVIGPWLAVHENYTCLFDGHAVPAVLLQGGVLRCFCPGGFLLRLLADRCVFLYTVYA